MGIPWGGPREGEVPPSWNGTASKCSTNAVTLLAQRWRCWGLYGVVEDANWSWACHGKPRGRSECPLVR